MNRIVINCRQTSFHAALGVVSVLLNLSYHLREHHRLTFVVDALADVDASPVADRVRCLGDVITFAEARRRPDLRSAVELLPHHFQTAQIADLCVSICHDLNSFDVPWKYGDRAHVMQAKLRTNMRRADAVFVEFPRTYVDVERVVGFPIPALFLLDAPLLLDTSSVCAPASRSSGVTQLLYPAQLQTHKNHHTLVDALARVRERGIDVQIRCPGSEFEPAVTAEIRRSITASGLEASFELLGRVNDQQLLAEYETCDGVIVPSLAEGGAYVALEGIAAGKPVAASDLASARMHADQFGAEIHWFDPNDLSSVAGAIEHLAMVDAVHCAGENADCRDRLARKSWATPAALISIVVEALLDGTALPILRTDGHLRSVDYGIDPGKTRH